MFNRKKQPKITFFTDILDLSQDQSIQPKPAFQFAPSAWKRMPRWLESEEALLSIRRTRTVKACPSFIDYFSQGFILPAWCDMAFKYDPIQQVWIWGTGTGLSPFKIEVHGNNQMLDHMDYKHRGENAQLVFKLLSPWYLKTPKGWSVLQLPLFYHAEKDWQVMAGIIDTDVHHIINQQVIYFGNGKEVLIKKGEPLVHYIPFKRTNLNLETKRASQKETDAVTAQYNFIHSKATNGYGSLPRGD